MCVSIEKCPTISPGVETSTTHSFNMYQKGSCYQSRPSRCGFKARVECGWLRGVSTLVDCVLVGRQVGVTGLMLVTKLRILTQS